MLEGIMAISLVVMGIYFFKSTDLPKEMKDRSAQMEKETITVSKKKMAYTSLKNNTSVEVKVDSKKSTQSLIDLHNKAIDELTLKITTLEQELKANNERNSEIQKEIDTHLESLRLLNEKISKLA